MRIQASFGAVVGLAVAAVGVYVLWRASSAAGAAVGSVDRWVRDAAQTLGGAAAAAVDAVNPASANNLAYRGVNAGLTSAAGAPTYVSDGIFAVFNSEARRAEQEMFNPAPSPSVYDLEDAELGAAMRGPVTNTPGGAFIGYGHAFGRRR